MCRFKSDFVRVAAPLRSAETALVATDLEFPKALLNSRIAIRAAKNASLSSLAGFREPQKKCPIYSQIILFEKLWSGR